MARWALLVLCVVAVVFELRARRIPDWLCIAGFAAGLAWNLAESFTGAGVLLIASLPFWMVRLANSGYVKLLAAVGSITGWIGGLAIFGVVVVLNGIWALIAARRGRAGLAGSRPIASTVLVGAIVWLAASR